MLQRSRHVPVEILFQAQERPAAEGVDPEAESYAMGFFPVPFDDVEDSVLVDSDVTGDPAVASPFASTTLSILSSRSL